MVTVAAWDVIGAAGDRTAVSAPQTFTLSVEGQSFKATPWTGDASTGISRSSTLWAWRMGLPAAEEAVINGVPVRLPPGPAYTSPGQFALEGETEGHPYFMSQPLGFEGRGSKLLANSYTDRGNPAVIRLEGLVPGRPYTLHVYGVGVPYAGGLRCTWSAEGEAVDIDEEVFGVHHGIRVSHDFTPRTDHYEITVMPRGVAPWAFSGLALNAVPARAVLEPLAGSGLSQGGVFDFGRVPLGLPLRIGFTLRNEGIVLLKDLKFTVEGTNADEFVVTPPTEGLVPGESRSAFSLVFRPTGPGPRKAVLRLASNEPEPFTLHLAGTGLPEAEIPICDLPDRTIDEDQITGPIGFTVDEPSLGRESALAGTSSDPALVPPTGIVFEGTGPHRRVVVRPAADRSGTAVVRVLASDGVHSSSHRFRLTVRPVNDPPRFVLPSGLVTPAGTDWAPRGSPRRWQALAASHDGRRLGAAAQGSRIQVSTDAGATWTEHETERQWIALASSADGSRLAAAVTDGPLLTSADSGATWVERAGPRAWSGLASSADGLRLSATVDGGQIHTSTNGGTSWTSRDRPRLWRGIASSADGLALAAIVPGAPVQVSTDGGATWAPRGGPHDWTAIASSADGSLLAATTWDGPIFVSRDAGATWTARDSGRFWRTIACSADGSRLVAGESLGRLHVSTDHGLTWTDHDVDGDWTALAWSGDGERIVAGAFGGPLFASASHMAPYRLAVPARTGPTRFPGFVTGIFPGPSDEGEQALRWIVTCAETNLFSVPPTLDSDGTLSFVPADRPGLVRVSLTARDDGGTDHGGSDTSEPQVFEIDLQARESK